VGRTVLEFRILNRNPPEAWQHLLAWFGPNGFEVVDPRSDGQEKVLPRWDGDMVLHPRPGSAIVAHFRKGGAAIVFELSLYPGVESTTVHLEGYVTGRGPGWKGKEYEFSPKALAVAGVPRKQGFDLLGSLQSSVQAAPSDLPLLSLPSTPVGRDAARPAATLSAGTSQDVPNTKSKAFRWTDRRFLGRPFPFESTARTPAVPATRLQSRLSEILYGQGFRVVLVVPPRFDGKLAKPGPLDPHRGVMIGERGIRVDAQLRRNSVLTAVLSGVIALVLLGFVFVAIAVGVSFAGGVNVPGILAVPAGLLLGLTLWAVGRLGSFDSDVIGLTYSPGGVPPASLTDSALPVPFDVRIVTGTIASRNWAGRGNSGRSFKAFRPSDPQLADVPRQVASQLGESQWS
jgi:hypothetical protein